MTKFIACKKIMSSADMAKIFRNNIVCFFGILKTITSDNNVRVTAQLWQELRKALGTSITTVAFYHQQANRQAEKTIQTLKQYLRAHVNKSGGNWEKNLKTAEFCYNSGVHETTEKTPFEMVYRWKPRQPLDEKKARLLGIREA